MKPRQTIEAFDAFLVKKGRTLTAIIIGGGALSLMGVISRETQDIDVLDPILPQEILNLSQEFAEHYNQTTDILLKKNWLNNGPESLREVLPKDWLSRIEEVFSGNALILHALGRPDLLKSKLFAFCDRELDRSDCILLNPTHEELREAMEWVKQQDMNPAWPDHVEASFASLAKELGHGI